MHQRTLVLYNMHLGLAGYERAEQVKRLLRSESLKRTWRKTALIVGGDLNDVWGTLGPRFLIEPDFRRPVPLSTRFPPFVPYDRWIACSTAADYNACEVFDPIRRSHDTPRITYL